MSINHFPRDEDYLCCMDLGHLGDGVAGGGRVYHPPVVLQTSHYQLQERQRIHLG